MKYGIIEKARIVLGAAGSVGIVLALGACGSAEQGSAEQGAVGSATEQLSVLEADEAAGKLQVRYESGGRELIYDLRLGPDMLTPPSKEELSADPDLPKSEVDARVLDANGAVIYMQMGGDGFIDPSWAMPQIKDVDEAGRVADIRLMTAATSAFRGLKTSVRLQALQQTAVQIGKGVDAEPATTAPDSLSVPDAILARGTTGVKGWDFQVRKHDLKKLGIKYGEHSAVLLRGKGTRGVIVFTAVSCNHGNCANASSMSTHCTSPLFSDDGSYSRYFYPDGCTTPYGWDSTGGKHNCNDDSELQGRAVTKDRLQSTTGGSCSSAGLHDYAPGCNY